MSGFQLTPPEAPGHKSIGGGARATGEEWRDCYRTPPEVVAIAREVVGAIHVDVAALAPVSVGLEYIGPDHIRHEQRDGLAANWFDIAEFGLPQDAVGVLGGAQLTAFCNPPFSEIYEFSAACARWGKEMSVALLCYERRETRWWQDNVHPNAYLVDTLTPRVRYIDPRTGKLRKGSPNVHSCIAYFGPGRTGPPAHRPQRSSGGARDSLCRIRGDGSQRMAHARERPQPRRSGLHGRGTGARPQHRRPRAPVGALASAPEFAVAKSRGTLLTTIRTTEGAMSAKNPTVQFTMREVDVTRRALAALKKRNDRKEERPALTGPEHASLNRIMRKLDKAWGLVALFALVCCSPEPKPRESAREPVVEIMRAESATKASRSIAAQLEREREAEALNAAIGVTTVAANSAFHAARSIEQDARSIACAAEIMAEMRAAEHWPLDAELARYLARVVIDAAAEHEIDPETLFGVGWRESRWMPAVGDGGRSCGMFQAGHRHIDEDCRELLGDVEIAANAAARHIASIDHICHYNQGTRCDPAERSSRFMRDRDGDGEPDTYAGRVAVAAQRFDHCFMPDPMPALVRAAGPEVVRVGSFSYARKRHRPSWERVPLGELPAACAGEGCIPSQWPRAEVRRSPGP